MVGDGGGDWEGPSNLLNVNYTYNPAGNPSVLLHSLFFLFYI